MDEPTFAMPTFCGCEHVQRVVSERSCLYLVLMCYFAYLSIGPIVNLPSVNKSGSSVLRFRGICVCVTAGIFHSG